MRVVKNYNAPSNHPCNNPFLFGQVEDYTLNILESSTTVIVENVTVATQNDVFPEITINEGVLQLIATVNPSEANQGVIWSVVSGTEFASVDENGLVTATNNGIVTIRATSVEDETKFGEIIVIVDISEESEYCIPEFFFPSSQAGIKLDQIFLAGESMTWNVNPVIYDENGYADYTNLQSVDLISGNSYDLIVHTDWQDPQYVNVRAWIDYNQNYQFDNEEEIGYISNGINTSGEETFNFIVPENTSSGTYRLRIVMQFPNSAPNDLTPCGTINSYGVAIDYNLQVIEEPGTVALVEITTQDSVPAEIITQNGILQLIATITPAEANQEVVWSVEEGEDFAFVDQNGLVTAITNGMATIRATSVENNTKYADIDIMVEFALIPTTPQTITVEDVSKVYGDAPFVNGESDSGLALTYTVSDESVAVFEDGQIVIVGSGSTEITASQSGNAMYLPAEDVTFTLTVSKAPLTLSVEDVTKAYDGEVYAAWTIVYDEFVNDDDATDLSGELIYSGDGVTAINPGTYAIEIGGLTSNNYNISFVGGELTITKAELTGITFEDALLIYDGSAKSLAISGTLPAGASVTYTGNGQSELGEYEVVASIDGGTNYNDLELTATLTITEGTIPGITFADGYFVYDGSAKSIYISGELPQGSTVSYSNNGQTEAGTYVVTATISGGELYNDLELSASLTIAKAQIQDLVFADGIFTYDGAEKSLHISGSLPSGVSVSYQNNGKVNAGVYTVVANISGNANYAALRLTAVLTIEKAPQQINFAALAPVSVTASDFQLSATASSGLAVRYSYSYDTDTPAAEVSDMGWVTVNHLGEITITVSQEGNSNYQAAAPVSRVLTVINKDASVRELWIENEYYSAPQHEVYHLIDCTDLRSSVSVRIVAGEGASIAPGKEFTIRVPKPGIYTQSVTVTSQDGSSTEEYVIVVEKPFSFKEIAEQKFNNTLLINNNPKTNGGYRFVAYQWFKDGELVGEEQAYSAGSRSLLDSHSVYHGIVTTEDGQEIHVCPMEIAQGIAQSIQLYPNPVRFGGATTLSVSSPDAVLKGLPVKIYNLKGQLVHTVYMDGDITTFELPQSMQSGMYIAVFELAGQQQSIKFIVE
jgi:hypothetical protein